MPRDRYNRTPVRISPKDRAALEYRTALDELTQVKQLQIASNRDREATERHEMDKEDRSFARENAKLQLARQQARDALEQQSINDETQALKFFSTFNSNKPNAEVELNAILASFPRAASSPVVRDLFLARQKELGANKAFLDAYHSATNGESVPLTKEGLYDLPRAALRVQRNNTLTEALSKGFIDADEAKNWKQMDEGAFGQAWEPYIAEKQGQQNILAAARARNEAIQGNLDKTTSTMLDVLKVTKPTDQEMLDPENENVKRYQQDQETFIPQLRALVQQRIDRASAQPQNPNQPVTPPVTAKDRFNSVLDKEPE